ncbi:MAG: beta-ketoacyl-ACP synthase III [Chloroflexota bacterium]|nr:beta-ketoacyl-ACP synthase III [Chloroflexota bacterium]
MPNPAPARSNAYTHATYAHIIGWGMAVPERIMTNDDLSAIVETDNEFILQRTGIRERRIASEKESTATLALKAAQNALNVADILPIELDLIIVATSTPEYVFPSTASIVQNWLGATKAGAFDMSAACSGFIYALDMASQAIRTRSITTALVIGAETMSRILDWSDRSTCILFGDGAGAVVLRASSTPGGVLSTILRSDGSGWDSLCVPGVGSRDLTGGGIEPNGHKPYRMYMDGPEVFRFATRVVSESVQQAVSNAGLKMDDIKLIVPHQANVRIIQSSARALKIDESRFMVNLDKYGNTSAASIPIALVEAVQQGRLNENEYAAFVGFGGGLAWGAAVVKWGSPKPKVEDRSLLKGQRRQLSYTFAGIRTRWRKLVKSVSDLFERLRPRSGRMKRLRERVSRL